MPGGNGNGPGKGGPEPWRADTVGLFSAASLEEVLPLSPRLLAFTFCSLATGSDKRFVPLRGNLVGGRRVGSQPELEPRGKANGRHEGRERSTLQNTSLVEKFFLLIARALAAIQHRECVLGSLLVKNFSSLMKNKQKGYETFFFFFKWAMCLSLFHIFKLPQLHCPCF